MYLVIYDVYSHADGYSCDDNTSIGGTKSELTLAGQRGEIVMLIEKIG